MTSNMRSIRIQKIADMVQKGMIVADIGTDHAFLPVYLVQNGIAPKAYACDISEGPLRSARMNIAEAGLSDQIPVIQSDGLDHVPADTQCIVIAGMGFETARGILERNRDRVRNFSRIIVEVNRDTVEMRQWISDHHGTIDNEVYIHEKKHDYTAISFRPVYHACYSEAEILFGPVLLQKEDPEYLDYLKRQKRKLELILEKSGGKAPEAERIRRELSLYQLISENKKDAVI